MTGSCQKTEAVARLETTNYQRQLPELIKKGADHFSRLSGSNIEEAREKTCKQGTNYVIDIYAHFSSYLQGVLMNLVSNSRILTDCFSFSQSCVMIYIYSGIFIKSCCNIVPTYLTLLISH